MTGRPGRWRLGAVLIAAAAAGPVGGSPVWAQPEARLDLVAQTPRTAAGPAAVMMRVTGEVSGLTIRVRLYGAVTARSDLLAGLKMGPAPPPLAEWEVEASRPNPAGGVIPLIIPEPGPGFGPGVHPLEVELLTPGGTAIDVLLTHVLMIPDEGARAEPMPVGIVVDLEAPVAHSPEAGAYIDPEGMEQALAGAEALAGRPEMPVTIAIDSEIFDALGRTGETAALASLQAAAVGNETLLAPWTPLDVAAWLAADQADVVLDGFARARAALKAVGVEAGAVSRIGPDRADTTAAWLAAAVGASGFVIDDGHPDPARGGPAEPGFVTGPGGRRLPVVKADTALAGFLTQGAEADRDDVELSAHRFLAELWRMALAGEAGPVVVLPPDLSGRAVGAVLDGLAGDDSGLLRPGPAGALLETLSPDYPLGPDGTAAGGIEAAEAAASARRRAEAERHLSAYESLIAPNLAAASSLRDLLAASANRNLNDDERARLLDAVKRQATAGMRDIKLLDRGRITIISRAADLPLTLVNGQPLPVTVALELSSEGLRFPEGRRRLVALEPGRNEVLIPIEARSYGRSTAAVAVITPEGGIILDRGTARVRSAGPNGIGLIALAATGAGLIVWWTRTARRRVRAADAVTPEANGEKRMASDPRRGRDDTVAGTETGLGEGS